ncbi:MAG: hypothetical protein ACJA2N_000095 [Salibacteraceae bacterium]|jgi:hypothetical protein
MIIEKPKNLEPTLYYRSYIDSVSETSMMSCMENSLKLAVELAGQISGDKESYAYAPGKWTVKQLYQHLIDCERILSYRVLSIARNEKGRMLGFDEDQYVVFDNSAKRSFSEILEDFVVARKSTMSLLKSLPVSAYDLVGDSNGVEASARTISWFIAGHTYHHLAVLKERYL